jgi:hypothetical protein
MKREFMPVLLQFRCLLSAPLSIVTATISPIFGFLFNTMLNADRECLGCDADRGHGSGRIGGTSVGGIWGFLQAFELFCHAEVHQNMLHWRQGWHDTIPHVMPCQQRNHLRGVGFM